MIRSHIRIKETDKGLEQIKRNLFLAKNSHVTVGIHHDAGSDADGMPNAAVGAFHEFGVSKGHVRIPQRSWLASTVDEQEKDIVRDAQQLFLGPLMRGKIDVKQALGLIGTTVQSRVQKTLREKMPDWKPLARSTKRAKARKIQGKTRSPSRGAAGPVLPAHIDKARKEGAFVAGDGNPLIDTGQMIQSVRYKVVMGGGAS